jgi:hypothetical protein
MIEISQQTLEYDLQYDSHGQQVGPAKRAISVRSGLNERTGWLERVIAPWRAEIAGRDQSSSMIRKSGYRLSENVMLQ